MNLKVFTRGLVALTLVGLLVFAGAAWAAKTPAKAPAKAPVKSPAKTPAKEPVARDMKSEIDAVLSAPRVASARVSLRVMDCATGEALYDFKPEGTLAPASNAKLFVTAAALDLLGAQYEYVTVIWRDGVMKGNVLAGNLVLQGSGDPNFTGRNFDGDVAHIPHAWAKRIADAGVKEISGDLVCDDSLFDRQLVNPIWTTRDQQSWDAPQVSALNFNENCIEITITPGKKPGAPAVITTRPDTAYVQIANTCKTSGSSRAYPAIFRTLGTNKIAVSGGIYVKSGPGIHRIPIHQPALYLGTVFAEELARAGVKLDGKVRLIEGAGSRVSGRDARALVVSRSTIPQTIAVTNKFSQDLYAEALVRLLGARLGKGGSIAEGLAVVKRFLTDKVKLPADSVKLFDGSGLADQDRCSAQDLAALMVYMSRGPNAKPFIDSLSVAGVDGTLAKRLKEAPYRGNIFGKTGRINGARTFTGYVKTRSGRLLTFSFMAGKFKDESAIDGARDKICRILYAQ